MTAQTTERYISVSKVRAIVRAEIGKNNEEFEQAIGEALRTLLGEAEARCVALEARINRLEAALAERRYVGQWEHGKQYRAGNLTTFASGIWHANADTREKPGTNGDWSCAVPKGRDGKDFTPPPPASPGGPRSVRSQPTRANDDNTSRGEVRARSPAARVRQ